MCSCGKELLVEVEGRSTCSLCGITSDQQHFIARYGAPRDPINVATYERRKRFKDIISRLLFPSIENKDFNMYCYLEKQDTKFKTVNEILKCMKKSKLPDKRYVSLHSFARRFLEGYKSPLHKDPHTLIKLYVRDFNMIETTHFRKCENPKNFFNYAWLLRRLLAMRGRFDLQQFVKPIKCPKRNEFYDDLFKSLNCNFASAFVVKCK